MNNNEVEDGCGNRWRSSLPAPMVSKDNISILSVLKQAIGRDLTRITIPVVYNEPLSFLQRLAEYMEYCELLRKADQCDDEVERFEYVAAFVISTFAFNHLRLSKPFNPLWFETFELDRTEEEGYRFVAEQVSHHPPVSAFHASSDTYEFSGTVSPKLRFWGSTVEVLPGASFVLKLLRRNEVYTWNSVNVSVHNIVMGQMYMNLFEFEYHTLRWHTLMSYSMHYMLNFKCSNPAMDLSFMRRMVGRLNIKCGSKEFKVNFKHGNDSSPAQNAFIEGQLCHSGKTLRCVYGNWTRMFASVSAENFDKNYSRWVSANKNAFDEDPSAEVSVPLIPGSKLLWKLRPRPANSPLIYNYTSFTLLLNDPDGVKGCLPRTDSRMRPDMRLLERGQCDEAAKEKERLEVKQRQARALHKKLKLQKQPKWFEAEKSANGLSWIFNRRYWSRDYEDCEDIF